jgi:hypothetical protein
LDHSLDLTEYQRVLVEVVLIGCTKIISVLSASNLKELAKTVNVQKKQQTTFGKLVLILLNQVSSTPFRPSSLKEEVSTQGSTTVDSHIYELISQNLPRLGILEEHISDSSEKDRVNQDSIGGPKKEYKVTQFVEEIDKLLNLPSASYLIYELIHLSAILYKYMKTMKLISYYVMKLNKDNPKDAWTKCNEILPVDNEKTFYSHFEHVVELSDEELEIKAHAEAIQYIKTHIRKDYNSLFKAGAIIFFA